MLPNRQAKHNKELQNHETTLTASHKAPFLGMETKTVRREAPERFQYLVNKQIRNLI